MVNLRWGIFWDVLRNWYFIAVIPNSSLFRYYNNQQTHAFLKRWISILQSFLFPFLHHPPHCAEGLCPWGFHLLEIFLTISETVCCSLNCASLYCKLLMHLISFIWIIQGNNHLSLGWKYFVSFMLRNKGWQWNFTCLQPHI